MNKNDLVYEETVISVSFSCRSSEINNNMEMLNILLRSSGNPRKAKETYNSFNRLLIEVVERQSKNLKRFMNEQKSLRLLPQDFLKNPPLISMDFSVTGSSFSASHFAAEAPIPEETLNKLQDIFRNVKEDYIQLRDLFYKLICLSAESVSVVNTLTTTLTQTWFIEGGEDNGDEQQPYAHSEKSHGRRF